MCKVLEKSTNERKREKIHFAFFGYADLIKYQEKPTLSYERAQITEARIISAHMVIKLYGAILSVHGIIRATDCSVSLNYLNSA